MAESDNITDINERLYVDSKFHLLNCKDSNDAPNVLRDLVRQLSNHCEVLNIFDKDLENIKHDLLTDYSNSFDQQTQPGLLPIVCDPIAEIKSHPSQDQTNSLKIVLQGLKSYLNVSDEKLTLQSSSNLNIPQEKNQSFKSKIKDTPGSVRTFNSHPPQIKPSGFGSLKRTVDNDDTKNNYTTKKFNRWHNSKKAVSQSHAEPPKSVPGFMSASSMYRNPLKKANEESKAISDSPVESKNDEQHKHESLKHFDKKIVDVIFNEIMDFSPNIKWIDIAGLEFVKTTVQEIVIWPLLRPDIFTGLRAPPRGILLFGPPGTGKTLIGKCIATESNSTFFCISASSLASKWVGESEQLVRALFTVANLNQPAVIFIDEIDSLLSQRSDKDQDFTRKLKTEFLVQFDGAKTSSESRVLVVGATNRPHELDEAARRRFVKRLYVPLPEEPARRQIIEKLLNAHQHNLSEADFQRICDETKGYSGSDVTHLCKEAAMGPIRSIGPESIKTVSLDQVRPIILNDFLDALRQVRASVAQDDLDYYFEWNKKFGSFGIEKF